MSRPFLFSIPSADQNLLPARLLSPRKRKRHHQNVQSQVTPSLHTDQSRSPNPARPSEYTAVVTPSERSQRRLAGLPVDQEPPPFPFPHRSNKEDDWRRECAYDEDVVGSKPAIKGSLHAQHLAAMTALLHRCLARKDYGRAGRALGLILRNEVGGWAVDLRSKGLWGIGAEILLMQQYEPEITNTRDRIARQGFERARLYYERLMVQYPAHKTWPDAVNTLDFCIAMFGLWVYVTNQESMHLQETATALLHQPLSDDDAGLNLREAKQWELEQAVQIAASMDLHMRNSPFHGDPELTRLRAMVALWTADCLDTCAEFEKDGERTESEAIDQDRIETIVVDRRKDLQTSSKTSEAATNRTLAEDLFAKLQKTR